MWVKVELLKDQSDLRTQKRKIAARFYTDTINDDVTFVEDFEPVRAPQQRAFARSARATHDDHLAAMDMLANAGKSLEAAVMKTEVSILENEAD
jgi:hypothetical protein